jgi:threonine/homoserine/homoserine lactone efflux protein
MSKPKPLLPYAEAALVLVSLATVAGFWRLFDSGAFFWRLTAMAVALFSDGAYAVLIGRAGALLSRKKVRLVSRLSGGCLIGGGLWLALRK